MSAETDGTIGNWLTHAGVGIVVWIIAMSVAIFLKSQEAHWIAFTTVFVAFYVKEQTEYWALSRPQKPSYSGLWPGVWIKKEEVVFGKKYDRLLDAVFPWVTALILSGISEYVRNT